MSMSVVPLPNSFGSRWAFDRLPNTIRCAWFVSPRSVCPALGQNGQAFAAGRAKRTKKSAATAERIRRSDIVVRLCVNGGPASPRFQVNVKTLSRKGRAGGKRRKDD